MRRFLAMPLALILAAAIGAGLYFPTTVWGKVDFLPPNEIDVAQETLGIPGDTALLTVDGTPVSAQAYLFWLGSETDQFFQTMAGYGMSELDLTEEVEPGVTWDSWLKDVARQRVAALTMTPQLAQEYGVELTDQEVEELAQSRQTSIDAMGGREVYARQLQALGMDDETYFALQKDIALLSKVEEAATVVDETVTPEEAAQYAADNDLLRAKHILLTTSDPTTKEPYDEAKKAQQRARADELLTQLRADPSQFDALMTEHSEDPGVATNPDGYLFSAGEMVEPFETGTRALEYGEISEVIESDFGYHIILRLDPDCDLLRQAVVRTRQAEAAEVFNQAVQAKLDGAQVELDPAYDTITAQGYYDKLMEFQSGLFSADVYDQSRAELENAG